MDIEKARYAIEETAKNRGISTAEVIFEIESAIYALYQQAYDTKDENLLQKLDRIPRTGIMPSAEEIVFYFSYAVLHDNTTNIYPKGRMVI